MTLARLAKPGALLAALVAAGSAYAAPKLEGALGEHAVIQRGKPIVVTGTAEAGETVTVSLADRSGSARADRDGRFRVTLPSLEAGGPYQMLVTARSGIKVVDDLLVGDVFLCSGQSNMEWPVERAQESYEVYASADDQLRLLTVPRAVAFEPLARFSTQPAWALASPASTGSFSAACYYMAREWRRSQRVPVGAIHASWSGSRIAPWLAEAGLRSAGQGDRVETLRLFTRDVDAATRSTSAEWEAWWRNHSGLSRGSSPWIDGSGLQWKPIPRFGTFNTFGDPDLTDYLGMVWFQTEFELTPEQAEKAAVLLLGGADDADRTWINGRPIGGTSNGGSRQYYVPAGVLRSGRNVLTVNIDNVYADGGLLGPASAMALRFLDGGSTPLGEGWRYAVAGRPTTNAPRAPWDDINGAGVLYNGMIAPLGPTALAGVAWYQGESDTTLPGYDRRLAGLMSDWRRQFEDPSLPFAVVQLPNFGNRSATPTESDWALFREVQRRSVGSDDHAALAVTIDLGDPLDLHPGQKRAVGERLARAMRALILRDGTAPSGPTVASVTRRPDGAIVVRFKDVTGRLAAMGADQAVGFELCGPSSGSCRFRPATPEGAQVVIAGDGSPVARVRYAWADSPTVNLFDEAGLPAGPFEMKVP